MEFQWWHALTQILPLDRNLFYIQIRFLHQLVFDNQILNRLHNQIRNTNLFLTIYGETTFKRNISWFKNFEINYKNFFTNHQIHTPVSWYQTLSSYSTATLELDISYILFTPPKLRACAQFFKRVKSKFANNLELHFDDLEQLSILLESLFAFTTAFEVDDEILDNQFLILQEKYRQI